MTREEMIAEIEKEIKENFALVYGYDDFVGGYNQEKGRKGDEPLTDEELNEMMTKIKDRIRGFRSVCIGEINERIPILFG